MSKSFKFKNIYLDTKGIVHNRKLLSDMLNKLSKNPVGEFTIWEGNKLITNDKSTFQYLGTHYWLKEDILSVFPLKAGFVRKAKLVVDYTDNFGAYSNFIRFSNDNYIKEYSWGSIQGNADDGKRNKIIKDFDFDSLPLGHIDISATPSWSAIEGVSLRFYRIYLLIYDELEV